MHSLPNLWEYFPSAEVPIPMIRFLLPALLLLVASCQAPQNSQSDCCASSPASPASLTSPAKDCPSCSAKAASASQASMEETCVMAGTGACEEGGDCPMQAACDAGVSACGDSCEMKAKNNAAATKALLMEATAACESCTAEKMCSDCDSSVKAMWAACEGCTEGAFCDDCLKSIKASMAGHCDGGSCESTQATGATKASAETTTTKSSCCDTPQG